MKTKYAVAKTSPTDVNLSTQVPDRDFNTPATDPSTPTFPYGGGQYPSYDNGTAQDVDYDIYGGSYAQTGTYLDILNSQDNTLPATSGMAMAKGPDPGGDIQNPYADTQTQGGSMAKSGTLNDIWESYGTAITATAGILIGILIGKKL